jgi:nucleotidyltransferase/DNA polymerase involved in DNA repair
MDAFYASVEQRDNPGYRSRPVVVGADPRNGRGRGVVAACSYEARKFGIHSALPIGQAFRLCPDAVFVRPDMTKYKTVSRRIHDIFHQFSDVVEPMSIDEAFLDVTHRVSADEEAVALARELKQEISRKERLTASVGIAPNKFVAKIASDMQKPDGLVLVRETEIHQFLDPLPIGRLWGVGPKTEEKLRALGLDRISQLRQLERAVLETRFGRLGAHLWKLSNGMDERPVESSRETKSISQERTFREDTSDRILVAETMKRLSDKVGARLRKAGLTARTVTVKMRYSDFTTLTRQVRLRDNTDSSAEIFQIGLRLFEREWETSRRIRLIGVGVSALEKRPQCVQLRLF